MVKADQSPTRAPNPWWVGVISGMASYIDASAIITSGIALVIYQHSIGITSGQIGALTGTMTLCIAIGALIGGRLGDRLGRRNVFTVTMAVIVAGILCLTFGTAFPLLFIGTVLVGVGTGADLPVSLATISEACTGKNRGAIIGLSNILWTVGIIVPNAISAVVGDWGRTGGQILFGEVGVVALIVLFLRLTIPESASWLQAREERNAGVKTVRANRVNYRDLLKPPYVAAFVALLVFYGCTNIAANTNGQFGTFVAVNVAGLDVSTYSRLSLIGYPVGILAGLVFMRYVGTKLRMRFYVFGASLLTLTYLIPVIFGFNATTIMITILTNIIGGAFAFEGIMKVWTQESFPTMLRSSSQGMIVAVARVATALVAYVTPILADANARALYGAITVVILIGLIVGWCAFHNRTRNEFDVEERTEDEVDTGVSGGATGPDGDLVHAGHGADK